MEGLEARRARRVVADGASIVDAAVATGEHGEGPRGRVERWKDLRARQWGMPAQLWDLLNQPGVTDVLINGTEAWVDRGRGCERTEWAPSTEDECRLLATQMAAAAGKRLDDASPLVDAFLGESVRVHAVIPPLSKDRTAISVRVLRPRGFSLGDLVELEAVPLSLEPLLRALVERRVSTLISGATGSGKTTLLGALLGLVPADQRIVCIEEVSELFPDHPHVIHLQERQSNIEGSGAVSLTQLVRAALRMRPDRLILGECRGPEVREVLTAMNTGHAGGFATIHAGSVGDVPARLAALGALAGLDRDAVCAQAVSAFRVVLQLGRSAAGTRCLVEVGVLNEGDRLECPVALDCRGGDPRPGPALERLEQVMASAT